MHKGCLEQGTRGALLEDLARLNQCVRNVSMIRRDEVPARVALAGQVANFVAGGEDRLKRGAGIGS